nr:alcohol dehydrogenase catalytic domain-containing protein [Paraburkholderia sp. BL6669N2]
MRYATDATFTQRAGYEGVGVAEKIGEHVRDSKTGDRVVIPSTVACGYRCGDLQRVQDRVRGRTSAPDLRAV